MTHKISPISNLPLPKPLPSSSGPKDFLTESSLKIADYLFDISPSGSYTSEIAYHVKTTPTNVIGAIRGMESRYREEESLINLHVVEPVKTNSRDIKLYRITDFGKEIVESLRNNKRF